MGHAPRVSTRAGQRPAHRDLCKLRGSVQRLWALHLYLIAAATTVHKLLQRLLRCFNGQRSHPARVQFHLVYSPLGPAIIGHSSEITTAPLSSRYPPQLALFARWSLRV